MTQRLAMAGLSDCDLAVMENGPNCLGGNCERVEVGCESAAKCPLVEVVWWGGSGELRRRWPATAWIYLAAARGWDRNRGGRNGEAARIVRTYSLD